MREDVIKKTLEKKIVVIVRGVFGEDCVRLAQALYEGGIELMEVTFDQSKPEAFSNTTDTLRLLVNKLGDKMVFGAGTVTSVEMVYMAKENIPKGKSLTCSKYNVLRFHVSKNVLWKN